MIWTTFGGHIAKGMMRFAQRGNKGSSWLVVELMYKPRKSISLLSFLSWSSFCFATSIITFQFKTVSEPHPLSPILGHTSPSQVLTRQWRALHPDEGSLANIILV